MGPKGHLHKGSTHFPPPCIRRNIARYVAIVAKAVVVIGVVVLVLELLVTLLTDPELDPLEQRYVLSDVGLECASVCGHVDNDQVLGCGACSREWLPEFDVDKASKDPELLQVGPV